MKNVKFVKTTDTLRIHFTTLNRVYEVLEIDEECCKILDNRGIENWVPFRYLTESTQEEFDAQAPLE